MTKDPNLDRPEEKKRKRDKVRIKMRWLSEQEGQKRTENALIPSDFIGFNHLFKAEPKPKKRLAHYGWMAGWWAAFLLLCAVASIPVSVQAQALLGWGIVSLFMILTPVCKMGTGRILLICLGGFISLRYILWRSFYTLPDPSSLMDFIPAVALFLCEIYAFCMYMLSLFVIIDPVKRAEVRLPKDPRLLPTVDLFIPTYNEESDILRPTLIAAKEIDYPKEKLRIYLLDDGATLAKRKDPDPIVSYTANLRARENKKLCDELGITYLSRDENKRAKAGNLNFGFHQTSGDLVAVLDADHVPSQDFLSKTVGYFLKDSKLCLVQTPHFFINPDPLEHNLETFSEMPSENEMFYDKVQQGLDKWNAAFFCGSAAVLKRSALAEIGGFEGETITEDCETTLELHARGYKSLYVNTPLIAGLQPENFLSFIGQRSRWAMGMLQIFMLKRPFFKRGLSVPQRLSYLSSNLFWLFSFARLGFIIAPLFYLFFGLKIYDASLLEFIAYTIPHILACIFMGHYLYGQVRWPLMSELYEYVQSLFLCRAAISTVLHPKKPQFSVTEKGEVTEEDHLSPLVTPFLIMFFLVFAGLLATIYRLVFHPEQSGAVLIVGLWNLISFLFVLAGVGVVCEKRQLRKTHRLPRRSLIRFQLGEVSIYGRLTDLSLGGAKIQFSSKALETENLSGQQIILQGSEVSFVKDQAFHGVVRHVRRQKEIAECGIEFTPFDQKEEEAIVALFYANHLEWKLWQEKRRRSHSVFTGVLYFMRLALVKGVKGVAFALWSLCSKLTFSGRRH